MDRLPAALASTTPGMGHPTVVTTPRKSIVEVYREHVDFVWRTARRMRVDDRSIDDVVQDVFVVVHRRLDAFDDRMSMRGWLYGVTQRVVSDHRRRARRKDAPIMGSEVDEQGEERFVSRFPAPHAAAEQSESIALLERLLQRLPAEKSEVLILAHLEQMTVPEIADCVGANVNTVYSRLRAARSELEELVRIHRERRLP